MNKSVARIPLSRDRVLHAALELADNSGLAVVSMRQIAQGLGVEAMSLYKHVTNKDDLLDGMVELVVSEMGLPSPGDHWKVALHERANTVRKTLNRHPWAANLIESRSTIGPMRLRHNDGLIGVLRNAGFSIELAFNSMIALTSYVYGFVILEEGNRLKGRPKELEKIEGIISESEYPYIFEMINYAYASKADQKDDKSDLQNGDFADFEFGVNQLLDGIERELQSK